MCEVLKISRKTYYKYRYIKDRDYKDYKEIKKVFKHSLNTYGYRRISDELQDRGYIINRKKVLRIMNKYGFRATYIKVAKNNSKAYIQENRRPDLIQREFNQKGWVTDITYLIYRNKRAYLSTILDLQTRKIVTYQISMQNDNKLVLDTLNKAIKQTKDLRGLIIHSDQGSQYLSNEYKHICISNGILISMSRKGTPLDNAVIESFHSLLKKETLYNNDIKSLKEYIEFVHLWLSFYNTSRRKQKK
jgi:transposase InsO family protein